MAENNGPGLPTPPRSQGWLEGVWSRLAATRPVWLGMLPLLGLLLAFGGIGPVSAFLLALGLVVLLALPPRAESREAATTGVRGASIAPVDAGMVRLADVLPAPVILLDRQGIVLYANAAAVAAVSVRIGDSLAARLRAPEFLAALDRVTAGGGPERVDYAERLLPGRSIVTWLAPMREEGEARPSSIAIVLDDLTELRRSERVRADFVANASHELRTPLASLSGFIETLQGPAREDTAARERFLGVMHEQATRMKRLIDDLLSLSRVEMAPRIRSGEEVGLVATIRHVADALAPLAREYGVAIETEVPAGEVVVPGERDELVQVFDNLVENACRYGAQGKRVLVSLSLPAEGRGECVVAVRDFGPGIAPEHLPRLTERFYRVDLEASRRHRGTGLGLAIVKHILNRHGARLSIESRLGEGARFSVHFPRSRRVEESVVNPAKAGGRIDVTEKQ